MSGPVQGPGDFGVAPGGLPEEPPIVPCDHEILAWRSWVLEPLTHVRPERDPSPVFWSSFRPGYFIAEKHPIHVGQAGCHLRLRSVHRPVYWDSPTLAADRVPSLASAHGIYALKRMPEPKGLHSDYVRSCGVYGQVALSGIVIQGEHGYRAERCVIRSLQLGNPHWWQRWGVPVDELVRQLEARYQCDVTRDVRRWEDYELDPGMMFPNWGMLAWGPPTIIKWGKVVEDE